MPSKPTRPRWWQRLLQVLPSTRVGAWLSARVFHRIDRPLMRLTGGRISTAKLLAGLPTVRLTTTGAKTGRERTVPVMGMRDGDRWVLVASSWGQDRHPAWYHNLRANPVVELAHEGETGRYVAREATDEEWETYWEWATDLYRGFEGYRRRADREIPIVVLEPAAD